MAAGESWNVAPKISRLSVRRRCFSTAAMPTVSQTQAVQANQGVFQANDKAGRPRSSAMKPRCRCHLNAKWCQANSPGPMVQCRPSTVSAVTMIQIGLRRGRASAKAQIRPRKNDHRRWSALPASDRFQEIPRDSKTKSARPPSLSTNAHFAGPSWQGGVHTEHLWSMPHARRTRRTRPLPRTAWRPMILNEMTRPNWRRRSIRQSSRGSRGGPLMQRHRSQGRRNW